MGVPPDAALARKRDDVSRILRRPLDKIVPSPRRIGYRSRITLRPDRGGQLGYTRPGTHDWVPVPSCAIARPSISQLIDALRVPSWVAELELRTDDQHVVVSAWSRPRHGRRRRGNRIPRGGGRALVTACEGLPGISGVALDGRTVSGDPRLYPTVGGAALRVSPGGFLQVNPEVNALLVTALTDAIATLTPAMVLDLFAGGGNLSLPLARSGVPVTLLESNPAAVADARHAAATNGATATIQRGDAMAFQAGDAFFDVAILDPPRGGAPGVLGQLLTTRPRAVFYVSCNPRALARDLGALTGTGYQVTDLTMFDMFPQTPHAEVLCTISPRRDGNDR